MYPLRDNESGQVGGIAFYVGAFIILGMVYVAMGPIVDAVVLEANSGTHSQITLDTIQGVLNFWRAVIFIITLGLVLYIVLNSIRKSSGPAY